eukprot:Gb_03997 [translate_table: standard]
MDFVTPFPPLYDSRHKFCSQKHIQISSSLRDSSDDGFSNNSTSTAYAAVKGLHKAKLKMVLPDKNQRDLDVFAGIASLLQAYTSAKEIKQIHAHMLRIGLDQNIFLVTKLVTVYATSGSVDKARLVFDKTSNRDVFLWNTMIRVYARNGLCGKALTLYYQMLQTSIQPNNFTFPIVLNACAGLSALKEGKAIYDDIVKYGFESDIYVRAALVDMYAKCGSLENARQVFEKMSKRDVVSWNGMIAGYAHNGRPKEALKLFTEMQLKKVKPNKVTMVSVLQASAHLGSLQQGKWVHEYIVRNGFELDVVVGTSLIDMYAKCGSLRIARELFDKISKRDVASWNAMIAGYGMHGRGEEALALFSEMQRAGIKPNHITFVGVLSACSHAGLVDEGRHYFNCISRDYGITPLVEHYACVVDLLCRAGCLDEAQDFIKMMPIEPSASVLGALLSACRIHCNIELAEHVAERLFDLEPANAGYYVLLSNIYAAAGRWDDVKLVRAMMKERGVKKPPGCSLIEINNRVHEFIVGDRSHPQTEKIYAMLENLSRQMTEAGYVPDTNFVLHDVEEEVKENMIGSHSEKLAIAFGLVNTSPGTPIWIMKNLRVCGDCHSASKFISKISRREIIMRDVNRFHHFKDGSCSCGDYW